MKKILLLMAAMLVCKGSVWAGDLKVAVPLDDFKKMQSRLEALEKENNQLKEGAQKAETAPATASVELQSRLQYMENENNRLRQEVSALKGSQGGQAPVNADVQAKLDALSKENSQLREAARAGGAAVASVPQGSDGQARLEAAETENNRLHQEIKLLQAGSLAATYGENKISAREQYFLVRRANTNHVFKY